MMYDAIVIGSGFGGALAAYPLVRQGWRVLMIERGDWVQRGQQCWAPEGIRDLTPYYDRSTPYALSGDDRAELPSVHCVGGASVFYGGVSLRLRERDFKATPQERAARAYWPLDYSELEPYYAGAERLIGVAGALGGDPTEPWRSTPFPQKLPALSRTAARIADAAERLGFSPARLPLAVDRQRCISCNSCDGYACGISAKNDMSTSIIPGLLAYGMTLVANTAATRLLSDGRRITGVETVHTRTGERITYRGRKVILAAGALATPHLLLASGLEQYSPARDLIGAMLMRHCNSIVFGIYPRPLDAAREFHKQIGFNDLYFGHPAAPGLGKLGTIQQIHAPPVGLVRTMLPGPLARVGERLLDRMTGLIVIASDEPQLRNRVQLGRTTDALGLPAARITHRYTPRDRAARKLLGATAARVLREAGAIATFTMPIKTFSHGLGSVRMGADPQANPLDADNRFRGLHNLYVTDGSALSSSAGVNPSLTIAALAYRAGCRLAGTVASAPSHRRLHVIHEVVHA